MSVEIAGRLSDDISRCLDRECPDSVICARFAERGTESKAGDQ